MKSNEIGRLLPEVYQLTIAESAPLQALLQLMQDLHEPAEEILSRVDRVFNPYSTEQRFVAYLGAWLDLERYYPGYEKQVEVQGYNIDVISPGTGHLRELIAAAARLSKWRGTAKGMQDCLELATGIKGFSINENVTSDEGKSRPFHIKVSAPDQARKHLSLVERIIDQEKPAYVTSELEFK